MFDLFYIWVKFFFTSLNTINLEQHRSSQLVCVKEKALMGIFSKRIGKL